MSTLQTKTVRLGDSATLANNFELVVPSVPDGTLTLQRQDGTDVLTVNAAGRISLPTNNGFEAGTYLPVVSGTTTPGTATYVSRFGKFRLIGDLVFVNAEVNWTGHTGTGGCLISLPVPTDAFYPISLYIESFNIGVSDRVLKCLAAPDNGGSLKIFSNTLSSGSAGIPAIPASGNLRIAGMYIRS